MYIDYVIGKIFANGSGRLKTINYTVYHSVKYYINFGRISLMFDNQKLKLIQINKNFSYIFLVQIHFCKLFISKLCMVKGM